MSVEAGEGVVVRHEQRYSAGKIDADVDAGCQEINDNSGGTSPRGKIASSHRRSSRSTSEGIDKWAPTWT